MLSDSSIELIYSTGGEYQFFSQRQYVDMNRWGDPKSTQRQGAWCGNVYNSKTKKITYGLGGGICGGLAAAYLIAGVNSNFFKAYLFGHEGKAFIRGMMNLQAEFKRTGGDNPNKLTNEFLKIYNVNYIKESKVPQGFTYKNIGDEILKRIIPEAKCILAIYGGSSAHALALRVESGKIKLFDPSYCEVIYPYGTLGSQAMANFLSHFIHKYYPWFKDIYIQRYAPS